MKNLILSGGGIKGIAYIGCLKYFEEHNMLKDLELCVCCSAGSIFCLLILLGYTSKELIELVNKLDMTILTNVTSDSVFNFLNTYGLDNGEKFHNLINIFIKKKLKIDNNITLKEFYNINKKELYITTCCINDKTTVFLNHKTHPDLELSLAIRMSFTYPFYFSPIIYDNKYYIDGGLLNNFPVDIDLKLNDKHTISIDLLSNDNVNITSFELYCIHIFNTLYKNIQNLEMKMNLFKKRNIIFIKFPFKINDLEFSIEKEKINKIIDIGFNSLYDYFKKTN